ncbi:MAG: hypothetical protein AVDCRST_MAG64-2783, partial [uncultured Phycisphaerae bacterium]
AAGLWRVSGDRAAAPTGSGTPDEWAAAGEPGGSSLEPERSTDRTERNDVADGVGIAPSTSPTQAADVRRALAELARECELREQAVRRVLAKGEPPRGSRAARRASAARLDPLMELEWQREQAALVLVRQGDRLSDELNLPKPAALAYRSASDTFPGTHWGAIARARLSRDATHLP